MQRVFVWFDWTFNFIAVGFIPPTQGSAIVNGYDINEDIANVRDSLGLCPQHDILFDDMTVEEHLYFFGKVGSSQLIQQQIRKLSFYEGVKPQFKV